jgi:NADH:ubiquinone oxidoreductase subunit
MYNISIIPSGPGVESVQCQINVDTFITLGIDKIGLYSEVYTGENYNSHSIKRSYSRIYRGEAEIASMPSKYHPYLKEMRNYRQKTFGS